MFAKCEADHRLVVGSGRQIGDRQDLMSQPDQRADNYVVTTLVGEKPHHCTSVGNLRRFG